MREPEAPKMLAPYEWNEWLKMCKDTGSIEAALSESCRWASRLFRWGLCAAPLPAPGAALSLVPACLACLLCRKDGVN